MAPEAMRLEDRLSTDLLLDLDSLSMHHLQTALSREFEMNFDFRTAAKTHAFPLNYLEEPTIKTIVEMVDRQ